MARSNAGTPASLFKYHSVSPYSLGGLSSTTLYFASPLEYNDPYDSQTRDTSRMDDEDRLREFVLRYSSEHLYGDGTIGFDLLNAVGQSGDALRSGAELALAHERKHILAEMRICCFSEKKNDMVLWSHYGDQHRGMCIEFDTSAEPINAARRVTYTDSIPEFDFRSGYMNDDYTALIDAHRIKYSGWSYEREWRIVEYAEPKRASYYYTAIQNVYLGARMPPAWKSHIHWILSEFPPGERPGLFELSLDLQKYHLVPKKIDLYGSWDAYADDRAAWEAGL